MISEFWCLFQNPVLFYNNAKSKYSSCAQKSYPCLLLVGFLPSQMALLTQLWRECQKIDSRERWGEEGAVVEQETVLCGCLVTNEQFWLDSCLLFFLWLCCHSLGLRHEGGHLVGNLGQLGLDLVQHRVNLCLVVNVDLKEKDKLKSVKVVL